MLASVILVDRRRRASDSAPPPIEDGRFFFFLELPLLGGTPPGSTPFRSAFSSDAERRMEITPMPAQMSTKHPKIPITRAELSSVLERGTKFMVLIYIYFFYMVIHTWC